MNFCKRSYQPILRYLYTETIKGGGEILLHKHFNVFLFLRHPVYEPHKYIRYLLK